MPETVYISIENLSTEAGTFLTPTWIGVHDGRFDLFDRFRPASVGLERLAEDGNTEVLSQEFNYQSGIDRLIVGGDRTPSVIDPREIAQISLELNTENPNHQYLSYASMFIPSNDIFIANEDSRSIDLFDDTGNLNSGEYIIYGDRLWDAGTEVNDENENSTAFAGQEQPNTGTSEGGVVSPSSGYINGGRLESLYPGAENLVDSDREIAKLTVHDGSGIVTNPNLVELTITVTNLAPENGTLLSPVWYGFSDGTYETYDPNRPASPGLESLAEDGDASILANEFSLGDWGYVQGTINGNKGADPGILDTEETVTHKVILDRSQSSSRYFNYASMILPSNDAFVANGNGIAHEIFDRNGNFLGVDLTVKGSDVLDAGTEINDELPSNTAFFGQTTPNTGENQNRVVTPHPGFKPEGSILNAADFSNADFTQPNYDLARITITSSQVPTRREIYGFLDIVSFRQFYTPSIIERDYIVNNLPQYRSQGIAFLGGDEATGDPIYRFFNTSTGQHLYTPSEVERDAVLGLKNYNFEGIGFYAYKQQIEDTEPLYRFYNTELDTHFYTTSPAERDGYLSNEDFVAEGDGGIAFYVDTI
ncbi:spondin domain-containing protein [Waterburya agarophytonicola K14]|uniref:Spondin domain-containing protein n=1 Tax=Waterburya agarophytonicola KI4 TaxID=2874699 RepID=A0A964FEX9_9CYAN|nr:spondin domain-containing protein [Waterburya agarophytonicola]MCC0176397.1 spondin domain-containing protein [Waterburya agarophytonicola KI4]